MPFHVSAKFMFNSLANVRLVPLTGPQELEHRSGSRACSSPKGCLAIPLPAAVVEVLLNSVTGLDCLRCGSRTMQYGGGGSGHERGCVSRLERAGCSTGV